LNAFSNKSTSDRRPINNTGNVEVLIVNVHLCYILVSGIGTAETAKIERLSRFGIDTLIDNILVNFCYALINYWNERMLFLCNRHTIN